MQHISLNDEWAKGATKEEFKVHFEENGYDWSDTDIEAYWNGLHPTPAKLVKNDTKPNAPASNGVTKQSD